MLIQRALMMLTPERMAADCFIYLRARFRYVIQRSAASQMFSYAATTTRHIIMLLRYRISAEMSPARDDADDADILLRYYTPWRHDMLILMLRRLLLSAYVYAMMLCDTHTRDICWRESALRVVIIAVDDAITLLSLPAEMMIFAALISLRHAPPGRRYACFRDIAVCPPGDDSPQLFAIIFGRHFFFFFRQAFADYGRRRCRRHAYAYFLRRYASIRCRYGYITAYVDILPALSVAILRFMPTYLRRCRFEMIRSPPPRRFLRRFQMLPPPYFADTLTRHYAFRHDTLHCLTLCATLMIADYAAAATLLYFATCRCCFIVDYC